MKSVESVYKCRSAVMPDSIRHPERLGNTGFRLKDCRNDTQLSRLYKQTLNSPTKVAMVKLFLHICLLHFLLIAFFALSAKISYIVKRRNNGSYYAGVF